MEVSEHKVKDKDDRANDELCVNRVQKTREGIAEHGLSINDTNDDKSDKPIDRGWAWVILAVSTLEACIVVGQMKCYGIFFVQIQKRFQTSSSVTSLVFTLQHVFFSVGALLAMNIGQTVSGRLMVMIGAVMSVIMYLITALTEEIVVLNFVLGIGIGAANALMQPHTLVILTSYFVKYRGLANSLCNGGVSVGGLVLAPVYTKLFEFYGFTGTYIISAGVHAQIAVIGALMRPVESFDNTKKSIELPSVQSDDAQESDRMLNNNTDVRIRSVQSRDSGSVKSKKSKHVPLSPDLFRKTDIAMYGSSYSISSSLHDITESEQVKSHYEKVDSLETTKTPKTRCDRVLRLIHSVFDTEVIKMPVFQYYLIITLFLCPGHALIGANIAPHAFDVRVDDDRVAMLVSANAFADILSKFVFGAIADKKWIKHSSLIAFCALTMGIASQFLYFMNSFGTLMGFSIFTGFLHGVYFSLFAVLILEFLEFEKFKAALGFTCLVQGGSVGIIVPITGVLRDVTGQWCASYTFIGVLLLIGAVMIWFLPTFTRRFNKKRPQSRGID